MGGCFVIPSMFLLPTCRLVFAFVAAFSALTASAQLYIGADANSLFIKSGESFSYEGLTLTPSADFTLTNTTLSRTDAKTISPSPGVDYIARYFSFSNTTPAFSGTIRFSYAGATLTPLNAGGLELNIRANGTQWANVNGTDVSGSYVEALGVTTKTLNTLTLGSNITPLPVTWLAFTAVKKDNTALLTWITASETNTLDFQVQHSTGNAWEVLGTVKAAGNATTATKYNFVHSSPSAGWNFYRLLQRDKDGKENPSPIASVLMDENRLQTMVYPNPIQNGQLNLTLAETAQVTLYDAAGRKVLVQSLKEGSHTVNAGGLQGGLYHLNVGTKVIPIIIP
ncbi:MAG: T9SS type A sorting domain-containing protein [Sphingomonadales bacterium]|nr:T9SS type A sorting domain-containing protein [Sphingomonadales bacterium]